MFGKKVNVKQLESLIDAALVVEKNPEVALELQKLANQLKKRCKNTFSLCSVNYFLLKHIELMDRSIHI